MRKIYISGCAKSGTTMLNNLMTAFDVRVCPHELHLKIFIELDYEVARRDKWFLFTNVVPYLNQYVMAEWLYRNPVLILNITRRKEDVLKSEGGYVSEERYDACVQQKAEHGDLIALDVQFEEILMDPRGVQYTVADALGLRMDTAHNWEDYPDFVPESHWSNDEFGPRYGPRRLGEAV